MELCICRSALVAQEDPKGVSGSTSSQASSLFVGTPVCQHICCFCVCWGIRNVNDDMQHVFIYKNHRKAGFQSFDLKKKKSITRL